MFSCWEGRGCCGLTLCQRYEAGILFRLGRKSHLAPCMALGLQRRRAVLGETPLPSPVRTGRVFDSRELQYQKEMPPDKAGWHFLLMVEPAGIEPASASPLQAALHT